MIRLFCIVLLLLASANASAAINDREHAVKAAFVFNILKFTHLPVSELRNTETGLLLCVLNDRSMFRALRALAGRPTRSGVLAVAEIDGTGELPLCDAVLVGRQWGGSREQLVADAQRYQLLTITEQSSDVERGMMIGVVPNGARLAIEINIPATRAAGIRLSAELLQLSRLVDADKAAPLKDEPR